MPVRKGKDSEGPYWQYGKRGTKYHYHTARGKTMSMYKAAKQGTAVVLSQLRRQGVKI